MRETVRSLRPEAWRLLPSIVLTFFASITEAMVLASIVPLIEAVADDRDDLEIDFRNLSADFSTRDLAILVITGVVLLTILYTLATALRAIVNVEYLRKTRSSLLEGFLGADWPTTRRERQGALHENLGFINQSAAALNSLGSLAASLASLLVFVGAAFVVDVRAAVAIMVVGLGLTLLLWPLRRYQQELSRRRAAVGVELSEHVGQVVDSIDDITVFGAQNAVAEIFIKRDAVRLGLIRRARIVLGAMGPIYRGGGLIVIIGAVLMARSITDLDTTTFGAAALLLYRSLGVGQRVQVDLSSIHDSVGSVESLNSASERYETNRSVWGSATLDRVTAVELDGVDFSYDGQAGALTGVTLAIGPGELVGLAGPSGSGKSTLGQILMGLRVPTAGTYRVNGLAPHTYRADDWRRSFALVPQTTQIIEATVLENIRYFREYVSIDEVERAAQAAGIHEMIQSLPFGYDSEIGAASRALSGGQMQRLGIARALAGSPDVIVLDEPTSALDEASEVIIHDALIDLKGTCIIVVIAHRRSTLEACDRIVSLRDGVVGSDGSMREVIGDPS